MSPHAVFRCEPHPERARVRVRLEGELDLATVGVAEATVGELIDAGYDEIVLDLRDLEFIDSSGLHLVQSLVQRSGPRWAVIPGPPAVQRLFEITGLTSIVPFVTPGLRGAPAGSGELDPRR